MSTTPDPAKLAATGVRFRASYLVQQADYTLGLATDHRLDPPRKCAGKDPSHREAHPEQVRLSAEPARGSGQDGLETGRVVMCG
jgi:hypothetical protein